MQKETYAQQFIKIFETLDKEHDTFDFLSSLNDDHYLSSYYKRTKEDIKKNYKKYTIDVDKSEVGNSPGFKNDLMLLKRFSKKIEEHGCKK